jgi:hypothetical protein
MIYVAIKSQTLHYIAVLGHTHFLHCDGEVAMDAVIGNNRRTVRDLAAAKYAWEHRDTLKTNARTAVNRAARRRGQYCALDAAIISVCAEYVLLYVTSMRYHFIPNVETEMQIFLFIIALRRFTEMPLF